MAVAGGAWVQPSTLAEALAAGADGTRLVLAGGTDVYPAHATRPIDRPVLDISRVEGLRGIEPDAGGSFRFGALTTWSDIVRATLPPAFDGLRSAAGQVGGRQIQNAGTIAGNIVNASPAADGMPSLLALDARVEVQSAAHGVRILPLEAFVTGYRATALAPGELVTAVIVPPVDPDARSTFLKLGSRAYLVISIVSVAAVATVADGIVTALRVAVGACSPVPVRLREVEAALIGEPAGRTLAARVTTDALDGLEPIDDIRAPAQYRLDAALTLVRRALAEVAP